MKFKKLTPLVFLLLELTSSLSHAYDQKSCMQGIDETLNVTSTLDLANNKMSTIKMALLESGIDRDNSLATYLTDVAQQAMDSLKSASVISALRQQGSFKQLVSIDNIVRVEFQITFAKLNSARNSFVNFTGSLKNPSLREQALQVSQELEKISTMIRSCQK